MWKAEEEIARIKTQGGKSEGVFGFEKGKKLFLNIKLAYNNNIREHIWYIIIIIFESRGTNPHTEKDNGND